MQEAILERKSISTAQKNIEAYFETHDVQYVAEDAVFINMGTGEETKGREAIGAMLHYIYQVAFNAKAVTYSQVITESKAMVEGHFIGTHIGEFAGVPATGKEVNVPLCVTYDLKDGLVQKARIYMLGDVLIQQLRG